MMAFLGSASLAVLASDTVSPKNVKQGSGVNWITWYTLVTSRQCSKYHFGKGVTNKIFLLSYSQSNCVEAEPRCYAPQHKLAWSLHNIGTVDFCVLKDGGHFTKIFFEIIWYSNIHFHAPKQTLMSHLANVRWALITFTISRVVRTSVAMNRCNSLLVFSFIAIHLPTSLPCCNLYCGYTPYWLFVSSRSSAIGFCRLSLCSFPRLRAQSWPCQKHPWNLYTVWYPSTGSLWPPMRFSVLLSWCRKWIRSL